MKNPSAGRQETLHGDVHANPLDADGRIMKPKFSIGEYGFISLVFDSENNVIRLHSMR